MAETRTEKKQGTLSQNDRLEAVREFRERYNFSPNAEELIAANNAQFSRAATEAGLMPIDHNATAELDLDKLQKETLVVAGVKASEIGEVVSAAVRGNAISVVVQMPDGRIHKDVVPANDRYVAPRETPAEAASRQMAITNTEMLAEIDRMREETAAELANIRLESEQKLAEAIERLQQEQADAVGDAVKDAEKAQEQAAKDAAKAQAPVSAGDSSTEKDGQSQKTRTGGSSRKRSGSRSKSSSSGSSGGSSGSSGGSDSES
jgi:uncharacterized membrane protein YgcG